MKKLMIIFCMFVTLSVSAQNIDSFCCTKVNPHEKIMELEEVRKNIETVTVLDLSMQSPKITTIPAEISTCHQLKCLDLSFNRISVIPESFKKLENLTCLVLSGNHYLQNLPSFLNELPNLKVIVLEDVNWSDAKQKEIQAKFPAISVVF